MIYELTEEERAVMRKLVDGKHVVTIGEHARVKEAARNAADFLHKISATLVKYGYEGAAVATKAIAELTDKAIGEQGPQEEKP